MANLEEIKKLIIDTLKVEVNIAKLTLDNFPLLEQTENNSKGFPMSVSSTVALPLGLRLASTEPSLLRLGDTPILLLDSIVHSNIEKGPIFYFCVEKKYFWEENLVGYDVFNHMQLKKLSDVQFRDILLSKREDLPIFMTDKDPVVRNFSKKLYEWNSAN